MDATRGTRLTLEDRRQIEHIAPLTFAFLLPFLDFRIVLGLGGLAIVYALYLSPRFLSSTRDSERLSGFSPGKFYYAVGVLCLLLLFRDRLYIAAGIWGILAIGDAASNLVGRRWGHRRLPYNPLKSVAGSVVFWITGTLACWGVTAWNLQGVGRLPALLLLSALMALLCAIAEGLPAVVDDNLAIVWVGGAAAFPLFGIDVQWPSTRSSWIEAAAVTAAVALLARLLGWMSLRGTVVAGCFGILVYLGLGRGAFALLLFFVILGSLATRLGFRHKAKLGIQEGKKGERGIRNVLANGAVPFVIAAMGLWLDSDILRVAFAAAVATAALDTVATEIGQWLGGRPYDPVTFKRVPTGTQGAVSMQGTLAGALAAALLCALGGILGWLSWPSVAVAWTGALAGGFYESISASWFRFDFSFSDEALNLYSSLFGACFAAVAWRLVFSL